MSFDRFRSVILAASDVRDPGLLMDADGRVEIRYAPFDHVNPSARIVILGITPGARQADEAIRVAGSALRRGASDEEAMRLAKTAASFAGAMRTNLVALLDGIGIHRALGIATCATLWSDDIRLVQFASSLRYPVFVDGRNYSGTPPIASTPLLMRFLLTNTGRELGSLPNALVIPLGRVPMAACGILVGHGILSPDRVVEGLPHPSTANTERINYFLGRKAAEALSRKTNAERVDAARALAVATVSAWTTGSKEAVEGGRPGPRP